MMETESTSETSVNFYQITRRNIPDDSHLHWIEGWVDSGGCLDAVTKNEPLPLPEIELRLSVPLPSHYPLSYSGFTELTLVAEW
jgi:hypothetical protein